MEKRSLTHWPLHPAFLACLPCFSLATLPACCSWSHTYSHKIKSEPEMLFLYKPGLAHIRFQINVRPWLAESSSGSNALWVGFEFQFSEVRETAPSYDAATFNMNFNSKHTWKRPNTKMIFNNFLSCCRCCCILCVCVLPILGEKYFHIRLREASSLINVLMDKR